MHYLYKRLHLNKGDIVQVNCSHQSNICMMTDQQFRNYQRGERFEHHGGGGFFKMLPARLLVPYTGYWTVTIDLGGGSANITHSISVIPA